MCTLTGDEIAKLIELDLYDEFDERAAIIQYNGKRSREDAERMAYERLMDLYEKKDRDTKMG